MRVPATTIATTTTMTKGTMTAQRMSLVKNEEHVHEIEMQSTTNMIAGQFKDHSRTRIIFFQLARPSSMVEMCEYLEQLVRGRLGQVQCSSMLSQIDGWDIGRILQFSVSICSPIHQMASINLRFLTQLTAQIVIWASYNRIKSFFFSFEPSFRSVSFHSIHSLSVEIERSLWKKLHKCKKAKNSQSQFIEWKPNDL